LLVAGRFDDLLIDDRIEKLGLEIDAQPNCAALDGSG
jgi:hypothetical protein